MVSSRVRILIAAAFAFVLFGTLQQEASAHERRTVAGKYTFVVGWDIEPTFLEEKNAALVRISDAQTNQPIEGVEKTLKVDITNGGQTKTFDLKARTSAPGTYIAELIPTKGGSWVFQFKGDIAGTPIDERFESGPGRFNEPEPQSVLQFPVQLPSNAQLAQDVQKAGTPAEAAAAQTATADAQKALDEAADARPHRSHCRRHWHRARSCRPGRRCGCAERSTGQRPERPPPSRTGLGLRSWHRCCAGGGCWPPSHPFSRS